MHTPHVRSGGRYPVLRTLAILYLIGGAVLGLSAVVGAIWSLFGAGTGWLPMGTSPNATDRIISCVVILAGGFIAALSMFAIAEVLKLFIDVEHNTRLGSPARAGTAAATMTTATVPAEGDGAAVVAHTNRLDALDEETAEAALLRGH